MSSARDAVDVAIFEHGVAHRPMALRNAVLAALGIPADADADDVRAAMLMWNDKNIVTYRTPATKWTAGHPDGSRAIGRWGTLTSGHETRAAAVLALAAKLAAQEATDA